MKEYKECPYLTRYGRRATLEAERCWYVVYREGGLKKRKSLHTRNERIAQKRFIELCDRLDRGILGFSLRPRHLPFTEAALTYLSEGTRDLSRASVDRHRKHLFGLGKNAKEGSIPKTPERQGHLTRFFRTRELGTIGAKDVNRYICHRQNGGASPNTILKELATLSGIFRFYLMEELILANPVLAVRKPKLKLVRPNYRPTEEELASVFSALFPGARRFFLAFCNSGCRVSELCSCDVRDADLGNRSLRVTGKGGNVRLIPMNEDLCQCVREELAARACVKPDDPLFINRYGKRYRSLRSPLIRACKIAGVPHFLHHSLRHAYATLQHKQGTDIPILSRLLGHSNPTVTQNVYVDPFPEELRKAGEAFKIHLEQKRGNNGATAPFGR